MTRILTHYAQILPGQWIGAQLTACREKVTRTCQKCHFCTLVVPHMASDNPNDSRLLAVADRKHKERKRAQFNKKQKKRKKRLFSWEAVAIVRGQERWQERARCVWRAHRDSSPHGLLRCCWRGVTPSRARSATQVCIYEARADAHICWIFSFVDTKALNCPFQERKWMRQSN